MFLWNVYCAEVDTYGVGKTWTTPKCTKPGATAQCDFDAWLKFIERAQSSRSKWSKTTGVGSQRDLPTVSTAQNLADKNVWDYSSVIEPNKINPRFKAGQTPKLSDLLQDSVEAMQAVRQDTKNPAKISAFLDNAVKSLDIAIEMRQADQAENMLKDFKSYVSRSVDHIGVALHALTARALTVRPTAERQWLYRLRRQGEEGHSIKQLGFVPRPRHSKDHLHKRPGQRCPRRCYG